MPFGRLFDRGARRRRASVRSVYEGVVAAARDPEIYGDGAVPDSFEGRFEMMVWHLAFVVRRLRDASEKDFAQDLFDRFLDDMDKAMREAGVGDIAIPKRLQKMVRVWFGRVRALEDLDARTAGEADLLPILARNLYPEADATPDLRPLADLLLQRWRQVDAEPPSRLLDGASPFAPRKADA